MNTTRRQARELALQVLFQQEFNAEINAAQALKNFKESFDAPDEVWSYATKILDGIAAKKNEIDSLIEKNSSHWRMPRMALVDRNLLRIGVYEIAFSDGEVPPKAALNEAIEISKKYGTTDSSSFINGILDQILKSLGTTT